MSGEHDQAQVAEIRAWARDNGFEIGSKGRIPAGILAAYEAARRREEDDQDETGDPLAGLEDELKDELEDQDQAAVSSLPPPASLEEARARFGDRPRRPPGWLGSKKKEKTRPPKPAPAKVSRTDQADIEGKLALLLSVPAAAWQSADPVCGQAFTSQLDPIVRAAVPLICQSPDLVRWFTRGSVFMLWMQLAVACQPVAAAIWAHHIAHTADVTPDGKKITRLADGRWVTQDGQVLSPGQAGEPADNSVYTTVVTGHVPQPRPV